MSYKSPIEIEFEDPMTRITAQIQEHNEMKIMATINQFVSVDKEELIKTLNYDRQQYEKGYADAKAEYQRPQGKWEESHICSCGKILRMQLDVIEHKCENCGRWSIKWVGTIPDNFCSYCGAAMTHQEVQE